MTHFKDFLDFLDNRGGTDKNWVILVASSRSAPPFLSRMIQEVAPRGLPPVYVLTEQPQDPSLQDHPLLHPYVTRWLTWPEDSDTVTELTRDHLGHHVRTGSLADTLRMRLRSQTPSLAGHAEALAVAAAHDVTVLITGETGTGKTYLARLLHDCSPRKKNPFLTVPCGALSASLIESEFFGHVKGAFTGADRAKIGKFAVAGEGTLLLDEIDALSLEQQVKLLRVIETGEFEPVGSNATQVCGARIIAASNWDLEGAVEQGKFRQDLYYRLNVMTFHLPPLRERVQDIVPLARGLVTRFNGKFHKELSDIHPDAVAALEAFPWPGNIRQLENVVQQAVLMSTGPELLFHHLPQAVQQHAGRVAVPEASVPAEVTCPVLHYPSTPAKHSAPIHNGGDTLMHNREVVERAIIQKALVDSCYRRAHAAKSLGISRVTLYKKMKKYDLMEVPYLTSQAQ